MNKYKFLFSVIVPVYNTEDYLEECIESLINQTIGFENIQIILINDGSKQQADENICLKYKNKYPNNIVYELKKNGGLASARNTGYKYIKGKYVNFLDSDDKFEIDAFEKVYYYFEHHYHEVSLVVVPMKYFEAYNHVLSQYFNFNENKIVNILLDSNWRQQSACNCFFKENLIKKYYFNEECKLAEDVRLINTIMLNEKKYGYFVNTNYLYRYRIANTSLTNTSKENYFSYTPRIEYIYIHLMNISCKIYSEFINYTQGIILPSTFNILLTNSLDYLNKNEKLEFLKKLHEFVQHFDDNTILNFENILLYRKLFLLQFKHKKFDFYSSNKLNIEYLEKNVLKDYNEKLSLIKMIEFNVKSFNNKNDKLLILNMDLYLPTEFKMLNLYGEVDGLKDMYFPGEIIKFYNINIWDESIYDFYEVNLILDINKAYGKNINMYIDINSVLIKYEKQIIIDWN